MDVGSSTSLMSRNPSSSGDGIAVAVRVGVAEGGAVGVGGRTSALGGGVAEVGSGVAGPEELHAPRVNKTNDAMTPRMAIERGLIQSRIQDVFGRIESSFVQQASRWVRCFKPA